jgi:hypothetical protein
MRDMADKGRAAGQQKTHCPQGHEYTENNTRTSGAGGRMCITCLRERKRKYMTAYREANRQRLTP